LNGCSLRHSGCIGASAFTRSMAKAKLTYIGCSHHRVPSLSKVAIRLRYLHEFWRAFARHGRDELQDRLLRVAIVP